VEYHKIRSFKTFLCRVLGHRINNNPANHWCERCKLAYEEAYHPENYWEKSGIVKPEIDFTKIDNIEFADVDHSDYPDYSNAYIQSADYMGEPMNGWLLDRINEDRQFIHEKLIDDLF